MSIPIVSIYWSDENKSISYSNNLLNTYGEFDKIININNDNFNDYNNNLIINKPWFNSFNNIINTNLSNIGIGITNPKNKLELIGNFTIEGSIIPKINNNFTLGSNNYKFKDLYLSSNSSYFNNISLSCSNFILNDNFKLFYDSNINYSNIIYSNQLIEFSNNFINNFRITNIHIDTDIINIGNSNKFITNDIYNSNITFNSNINVLDNYYINTINIPISFSNNQCFFNGLLNYSNIFELYNETDFTINHKLSPNYSLLNYMSNNNYYSNKSNINWYPNVNNYYNDSGLVGIGTNNPSYKLDINGDLNFNGNLFINNELFPFSIESNNNITSINAINSSNYYIYYTNGSITFPQTTSCEVLIVASGGNGGIGSCSGGGGAGEVISIPSYSFDQGIYNVKVGKSSFDSNLRISEISNNLISIKALGGGNGGYSNVIAEIGGSGGGGYSNISIGALAGSKWNLTNSIVNNGINGTSTNGGDGGSSQYTTNITGNSIIVGLGGTGATINSIPTLKNNYGSGGDGNGGIGTQGLVIIKVPFSTTKSKFNGYIDYSNIDNRPELNELIGSTNYLNIGYNNEVNFPLANVAWSNEWFLYVGDSPANQSNSFIFWHVNSNSNVNSKWWFNGKLEFTNSEISDSRIKKEITDIYNPINKLMMLKPKEYYLCDEKDYLKKYGILAQDILMYPDLNHLVYKDNDFIANIYSKGIYNNRIITCESKIDDKIVINDIIKIILKNNINNSEIVIDDFLHNNRYKRKFGKIKRIINDYSFEIYENLELSEIEKNNLFIYGKKISDFNKLDYSSLYSLNIACNQEIYKLILSNQEKLENLEKKLVNYN